MNSDPIPGTVYTFDYLGGRVYDPDLVSDKGIFLKKISSDGLDFYLFAVKLGHFNAPSYYIRYIPNKSYIHRSHGKTDDEMYPIILRVIESPDYKQPVLKNTRVDPWVILKQQDIEKLLGRQVAREKIADFMTKVIHSPPIRNNVNKEKVLFTGGPMYKRGLASFTKQQGKGKSRKQRGGDGMGQPLKYTVADYMQPMANAGRNLQGLVPPITIRPGLEASPMSGGTMEMSPMGFEQAYHSKPLAPTGQELTFKLPATLNQGLNLGPLSGGRRRSRRRKNTRRGGFYPSIMGGVVQNAPLLIPVAARQSLRLLEEYKLMNRKTRRRRNRKNRKASRRKH